MTSNTSSALGAGKQRQQTLAQTGGRQSGGVHHKVGTVAQTGQHFAFLFDGGCHGHALFHQRMLAARFLVAADERRRVRVEEQNAVITAHALDRIQRIKQLLEITACTHIGDERHTFIAFGCRQTDLREARYEGDRQIIDAVIA